MEKMRSIQVAALLLLVIEVCLARYEMSTRLKPNGHKCMAAEQIPMCAGIGYNMITVPNFRNQTDLSDINMELAYYTPLVASGCSNAIVYLLCSIYAPLCYNITIRGRLLSQALPPCRNLCEYVRDGCQEAARSAGLTAGLVNYLDCMKYPEYKERHFNLCFGPKDPTLLTPINTTVCDWGVAEISTTSAVISSNTKRAESIKCSPRVTNVTIIEAIHVRWLEPDTIYSCTIRHNTGSTCYVEFTTQPTLSIQLINDKPDVQEGSIHLEFKTNREVATLECQLLATNQKQDCKNGTADFFGLAPGSYIIRILAENSGMDRATIRVRARVPEGREHCTVHLINRLWTLEGGQLTVWFEGIGPIDSFMCRVDSREEEECASPYTEMLATGKHKIRISPKGSNCNKRSSRTINVAV